MAKRVLVVAAHPDDEVLGCGGTIAKLSDQGANIHVAFIADGVSARDDQGSVCASQLQQRHDAAQQACRILGVKTFSFGDYPDNRLDTVALLDLTQSIESLIASHQPDLVLTHHGGDLNIDHRRVHQAVATACRPQRGHSVTTLLCFEVASSTEWQLQATAPCFEPNWFVDISETLPRKFEALDAYAFELRDWPHPRSRKGIRAIAEWRGATVGVDAAEAFMLGRKIA